MNYVGIFCIYYNINSNIQSPIIIMTAYFKISRLITESERKLQNQKNPLEANHGFFKGIRRTHCDKSFIFNVLEGFY